MVGACATVNRSVATLEIAQRSLAAVVSACVAEADRVAASLVGGLFVSHRSPRIDINLDITFFPESECVAPADRTVINVNDIFPANLVARNYYQGISTDFARAARGS